MSEEASQSGEIRLPRMVIPLGVDTGEIEVYLETLKNSSMVKGVSGSTTQLPSAGQAATSATQSSPNSTDSGKVLEALVAGISMKVDNIERTMKEINEKLDVIALGVNG